MKIYGYDYEGKFTGETDAEVCQLTEMKRIEQSKRKLKKGEEKIEQKFILPNFSTTKAPESIEGHEAFFVEGEWVYKEIPKPIPEPEKEPEPELTYQQKRAMAYPDFRDYLDGVVKSLSGDSELELEGDAQIQEYVQKCLAVKKKYPKPNKR